MCKEQESKLESDLISRQGVIDAIEGTVWYRINKKGEMVSGSTNEHESWYKHDDIMLILETIPSPPETHDKRTETHGVCSDCISRQAVFCILKNKMADRPMDSDRWVIRDIGKAIESLPPVEPLSYEVGYSHGQSERPKGEWVSCSEPPEDRRNVFLAHGTNDFKSCCIGHYEQGMGWYEDRNFFAKPIYDCKYWCDIPELPDLGNKQFGTEVSADMRGDKE